jgi:hypothetical protein
MQGGDLSNKQAPAIVIDMDDLLLIPPKQRWRRRLISQNKKNPKAVTMMEELYYNYDVSLYVVAFRPKREFSKIERLLEPISYSHLYCIEESWELIDILRMRHVQRYIYSNPEHYCWQWQEKCGRVIDWDEFRV